MRAARHVWRAFPGPRIGTRVRPSSRAATPLPAAATAAGTAEPRSGGRPVRGGGPGHGSFAGAVDCAASGTGGSTAAGQAQGHWAGVGTALVLGAGLLLQERQRVGRAGPLSCSSMQCVRVGRAADFKEGCMHEVSLAPEPGSAAVCMHNQGGTLYATSPVCSDYCEVSFQQDVSMSFSGIGVPSVTDLLHDATFDLRTGQIIRGPGVDGIATYKVEVVDGDAFVKVPSGLVSGTEKHQKVMRPMVSGDGKDKRIFALIGSGPASLSAAETLRQEGFTGRIVMVTKEAHLPYYRGLLSKNLNRSTESLLLRPPEFFEKFGIEVIREALVTRLDSKEKVLHFTTPSKGGESIKYDSVLVASGGTPRRLFVPGSTLNGIFTLRTPEDAANITKLAQKGLKIVVVGGSFIGMEVASTLKKKGCHVAVVAMETVPFERVLGKKVGAAFARLLQKEGVEWYGTAQVRLFRGNTAVNGVELEDGEVLPADAVVVGAGVLPNTKFLEGILLDKNGAIMVNPLLSAEAVPTVFAAGDVCSYPSLYTGTRVRIEHWDIAMQQGRVAARNMLGQYQPMTTVPFFWSDLFSKRLRFVGHAPDALDRVIVEGDVSGMEFVSYYTEDDEIRAVATLNRDSVAAACAELMRRGMMPKVSELMLGVVNADVIMQRVRDLSRSA